MFIFAELNLRVMDSIAIVKFILVMIYLFFIVKNLGELMSADYYFIMSALAVIIAGLYYITNDIVLFLLWLTCGVLNFILYKDR